MTQVSIVIDRAQITRICQRLGMTHQFIDTVIFDAAKSLKTAVQGRTPVGVSRTQGRAKRSWSPVTRESPAVAVFENPVPYSPPLEFGSIPGSRPWPRPGPRTMTAANETGASRIYSRQAPGGMVIPAIRDGELDVEKIATAIVAMMVQGVP